MNIALLIALVAVNIAYLVLLDRKDERAKAERVLLDSAWRGEVQNLLQRIQAPEQAVYEHATRDAAPDPDGMPMTDEQQAEAEERARALAFIEQFEVS